MKQHVDLKRYGNRTNEWRMFSFIHGTELALARNLNRPASCPKPPENYLDTRNLVTCPFYTVDYAELGDGSWTIVEVGDGQDSRLAAANDPTRFYEAMAQCLQRLDERNIAQ